MHHITQDLKNGTATCSCGRSFGTRNYIRNILAHIKPQGGYMNLVLVLWILALSAILSTFLLWMGRIQ